MVFPNSWVLTSLDFGVKVGVLPKVPRFKLFWDLVFPGILTQGFSPFLSIPRILRGSSFKFHRVFPGFYPKRSLFFQTVADSTGGPFSRAGILGPPILHPFFGLGSQGDRDTLISKVSQVLKQFGPVTHFSFPGDTFLCVPTQVSPDFGANTKSFNPLLG